MSKYLATHNTVGLIVDFQERLMPVMQQGEACVNHSRILLKGLQALDIKLIVTEQYSKGLGKTISEIQEVLPAEYSLFEKTTFSALTPEVSAELEKNHIDNVIILGAEAHVCMLQSVLDLQKYGFQTYVPFECTTSRLLENKQNALTQMQAAGAIVSNVESLLFQLLKDCQHPAFNIVSNLIK